MDYNKVWVPQDYGRIKLNFKNIMDEKSIPRNKLANLAGVRFEVINRLYNGETIKMDLDILARVCYVLDCDISDVLLFER